ncbi:hypothetical protein [Terribacillus saccharophilus]|uniref:hypothetical protein n=1 Tax=Terribacillus saccharophilus TaxID=361277 RepID=UPI002989DE7D|nr:hypothetical protein [Terribacillus saccharophilus]MCM3227527.1 hypothetical protein [Terribacillus saccharophilus]
MNIVRKVTWTAAILSLTGFIGYQIIDMVRNLKRLENHVESLTGITLDYTSADLIPLVILTLVVLAIFAIGLTITVLKEV